jgi:hypothetical protein
MTLTNVTKKQNPHKCEGLPLLLQKPTNLQQYYPITVRQKFGKPAPVKSNTSI